MAKIVKVAVGVLDSQIPNKDRAKFDEAMAAVPNVPDPTALLPGLFERIAISYFDTALLYSGENFKKTHELLLQPVTGIPASKYHRDHRLNGVGNSNKEFITKAIALAMQGKPLSKDHKEILEIHNDWLNLPPHLGKFAVNIMGLAIYYDKPEKVIEDFPLLYRGAVHPVFKKRFAELGINPTDLQAILRNDSTINPVTVIWCLSGADSIVTIDTFLEMVNYKPDMLKLANRLLRKEEKNRLSLTGLIQTVQRGIEAFTDIDDELCIERLVEFDKAPGARRLIFHKPPSGDFSGVSASEHLLGFNIPSKLNEKLDIARSEQIKITAEAYCKKLIDGMTRPPEIDLLMMILSELRAALHKFYPAAPSNFLQGYAKRQAERDALTWDKIPQPLRRKLEAEGYVDATSIARIINDNLGQKEITSRIDIIVENSKDISGYIVTEYEILSALCNPNEAFYANGMLPKLLYETIRTIVAPDQSLDEFNEIVSPISKQATPTICQTVSAELYEKLMAEVNNDPLLRHAVTEEQLALLLGIELTDFRELFTRPHQLYQEIRLGEPAKPNVAMQVLADRFGLDFRIEWELARSEHKGQRSAITARKPIAAVPEIEEAPKNIWNGTAPALVDFIKSKGFETPDALATKISELVATRTGSAESVTGGAVLAAFKNTTRAFIDGEACEPVYFYISDALELTTPQIGEFFGGLSKNLEPREAKQREALASITKVLVGDRRFASTMTWREFKDNQKIDIFEIVKNIAKAYQVRSSRDPKPVLLYSKPFAKLLDFLNVGLDTTAQYLPEGIIPVRLWREASKLATGGCDPIPAGKDRLGFEFKPA